MVPGLKNVGERSTTKSYCPVSLLSVVRQIFEKLVNNNLVDHHEKCGLFSNSQYGFRYSRSTAGLLTVVSDRVVWRLLELYHLIYSRLSTGVRRAGLLHKLRFYGISCRISGLISSFLIDWRLHVVPGGKSSQKHPVNAGIPQGSILGHIFLLLYIKDLLDDDADNIAIWAAYTTLYCKYEQVCDLCQQPQFASERQSNLLNTIDCGMNWLIGFSAGRTQLVLFDRSNNSGAVDMKVDGSALEENHLLWCWSIIFF